MELLEARRLTGPSLLADGAGAILDVACSEAEAARLAPAWQNHVTRMLRDLGWPECQYATVSLQGGISLFFTAPIDALYAATEVSEWAYAAGVAELGAGEAPDYAATLVAVRAALATEANVELLQLQAAARERAVPFLWDDDAASLGLGKYCRIWPVRDLPAPDTVDWRSHGCIPVGLVTGTNGKTTTVRLTRHILRTGGRAVGLTSTDWIAVDDRIIERGDWSGPGGARTVLRDPQVDVAVLECARGGMLRRGLGVARADAALITNVAEDHLGDFGSRNLDELLNIKWIVSRAVRDGGRLILNADDALLAAKAGDYPGRLVWFALDAGNDVVQVHLHGGGTAFVLDGADLLLCNGTSRQAICSATDIPITLGGAARHNVANALAAAALSHCLGASLADIRGGLTSMLQDANPGRCNLYAVAGRQVIIDFAHNPHAMRALLEMGRAMPARRRVLCFGQAGDRPDHAIRELARNAWSIGLDKVIVSELAVHYRGRGAGEVFAIISDELRRCGASDGQIEHYDLESQSLAAAMAWSEPGDLVIMLALGGAGPIKAQLDGIGETLS